jgi:isoleucyl-tRNA synthetase
MHACPRPSTHPPPPARPPTPSPAQASANGADELRYLLVVSSVQLAPSAEAAAAAGPVSTTTTAAGCTVTVGVAPAGGSKCARCWNYCSSVGGRADMADLCQRCHPIVSSLQGRQAAGSSNGSSSGGAKVEAAATAAA